MAPILSKLLSSPSPSLVAPMSTFPGRIKLNPQSSKINGIGFELNAGEPAGPLLTRPTSESRFGLEKQLEFDAGLNSSAAWAEHINLGHDQAVRAGDDSLSVSLSDEGSVKDKRTIPTNNLREEGQENEDASELQETGIFGLGRLARVLYDFNGESSAQELRLHAGEEIEVVQETIEGAEGWSLARIPVRLEQGIQNDRPIKVQAKVEEENGEGNLEEIGLVPREYYIFTTDFLTSPSEERPASSPSHEKEASTPRPSTLTITSNGRVTAKTSNPSLLPQNTGEWFKQQMRSMVLGGRSLNRFSRFVTSGAEAFILRGPIISSRASTSDIPESTSKSNYNEESMMSTNSKDGLPHPVSMRLSTYLSSNAGPIAGHSREPTVLPTELLPNTHYIDAGEAGPTWREKIPSFEVRVHSPEKRYPDAGSGSVGMGASAEAGAYIVYSVTSIFSPPSSLSGSNEKSDGDSSSFSAASTFSYRITVHRRFSHFVLLHRTLSSSFPALALSPLPQKQFSGRLNSEFVEARRRELERWLKSVVSHPVMRYVEPVRFFLGCEDEVEFRRQLPTILNSSHPSQSSSQLGRGFFSDVYHLPFQIDFEDSTSTASRFQNHIQAVSSGVQHFRHQGTFGEVRKARVEMSRAERLLSYEILGLITSRRLHETSSDEEDEEEQATSPQSPTKHDSRWRRSRRLDQGLQNSDGAWCWREDCSDCLRLTKCMQKTAETLQGVADLYDSHARRTMFETEDSLKDIARPDVVYAPILDIHKQTLERYKEASPSSSYDRNNPIDRSSEVIANDTDLGNGLHESRVENEKHDEDSVVTRCETVLNTTLAEFDAYHSQKVDAFERIVKGHLDGEIAFYEKVLSRLRTTRALFDASPTELQLTMPGPRQPSIYERDFLQTGRGGGTIPISAIVSEPLPKPAPHVLDSSNPSSMVTRPVSDAIHGLLSFAGVNGRGTNDTREEGEGVGRTDEGEGRGSMFSRLW